MQIRIRDTVSFFRDSFAKNRDPPKATTCVAPVKNDKANLPIGMQIIGKKFDEKKILDVAYFYEKLNKSEVEDFEGGVTL